MHPGGCKWCNIELITIQDCGIFPDELPNQEVFFAFKNIFVSLMLHGSTPGINIRWGGQNIESLGRYGYESLLCQAHVCALWVAQNVILCKVKSNLMSDLNFQPKN